MPLKAKAVAEWCKAASRGKIKWRHLYVPYGLFQQSASSSIADLVRACDPSLVSILNEAKTGQQELPLFEATEQNENEWLLKELCPQAMDGAIPDDIRSIMLQAVAVLDHSIRPHRAPYGHAFQPLLKPLDDLALRILENQLGPHIPRNQNDSKDYFNLYMGNLDRKQESLLSNRTGLGKWCQVIS